MNVRNLLTCLLVFCLLFSMNQVALAVDPYSFDRLWNSAAWTATDPSPFGTGPNNVAADSTGNIYVSSGTDNRILKISGAGALIAQWGSSGSGNGQFNIPKGIAVDSSGNIYVADCFNNRVQKFDATGTYLTQWNASDSPFTLFNPTGVAVDSAGNVYVTETGGGSQANNNRVLKFTSNGVYLATIGTGTRGSNPGEFKSPSGAALDSAGNIYVADSGNNRIQKFDVNGIYQTAWSSNGSGTLTLPSAVAVDSSGNVYVTDNNPAAYRIQKYNSSGAYIRNLSASAPSLATPNGLAKDGSGNLYVADTGNKRIAKFNSTDNFLSTNSITGNPAGFVTTFSPSNVAVAGTGKYVYVADIDNNRMLKFAADGTYQTAWGSVGSTDGKFSIPSAVAVDASGNVYVADAGNNRIQKFNADGAFQWKTAINIAFLSPGGVAVDSNGNVYVADYNNGRIVKVNATTGAYISQWFTYDIYDKDIDGNPLGGAIAPSGVAVDTAGNNVYVVYRDSNLIQKFNSSGAYLTQWGVAGSDVGQFSSPQGGVVVDSAGNVFVADTGNNRIQKFAPDGTPFAAWGAQGSANGQFNLPYGVASDVTGNIYVADMSNFRIQKFYPSSQIAMTMVVNGIGTVASLPTGISTNSSQTSLFTTGSPVTLTASPTIGASTFQSWGGDCSSCSGQTCQVTMDSVKSCSATFLPYSHLNVTVNGNGSVHSTDFTCNGGTCGPANYPPGTVVTLSATPSAEYVFSEAGWSGCDSASDNQCSVTVTATKNVTATFTYVKPAQVRLGGGGPIGTYDTLTAAYAAAPTGYTIQARVHNFPESLLILQNSTAVNIWGGYDETYSNQNGNSIFIGVLKIQTGQLKVNHLVVQQP